MNKNDESNNDNDEDFEDFFWNQKHPKIILYQKNNPKIQKMEIVIIMNLFFI